MKKQGPFFFLGYFVMLDLKVPKPVFFPVERIS